LVWKNVDSALYGLGDIDSAAPPPDWPALEAGFWDWVEEFDLLPAVRCHHIPGGRNLIAIPGREERFLEVSIKESKSWRGARLFTLAQLLPLAELDDRGFRRLRPGAEGLFKLALNGCRWGGRPNAGGLVDKRVAELLRADPEGLVRAAEIFGRAAPAARAAAEAVSEGGWDGPAMRRVEAHALGQAVREPVTAARRGWFRIAGRSCPVVRAMGDGRRVPADRASWLTAVDRSHPGGYRPRADGRSA
jgi:hypothetical protein